MKRRKNIFKILAGWIKKIFSRRPAKPKTTGKPDGTMTTAQHTNYISAEPDPYGECPDYVAAIASFHESATGINTCVRDTILAQADKSSEAFQAGIESICEQIANLKSDNEDEMALSQELDRCIQSFRALADEYRSDFRNIGSGCALNINSELNGHLDKMYYVTANVYAPFGNLIASYAFMQKNVRERFEKEKASTDPQEILKGYEELVTQVQTFAMSLKINFERVGLILNDVNPGEPFDPRRHQTFDGMPVPEGAVIKEAISPVVEFRPALDGAKGEPQLINKAFVKVN